MTKDFSGAQADSRIFETHAHYDAKRFDADRFELLEKLPSLPEFPVKVVVNIGVDLEGSYRSVALAEKYSHVFATVGCHPSSLSTHDDEKMRSLEKLCVRERVVGVGETGLDYYRNLAPKDVQKKWFIEHIEMARAFKLPIIVHCRDAHGDTMELLQKHASGHLSAGRTGVIHCYSGSVEMAKEYVKMGFMLGIGGVVTYKNAQRLVDTVREIPLEHLVTETDCPYLTPEPVKLNTKNARNSSVYLGLVVRKIAEIKGISAQEAASATFSNAQRLFFGE